MDAIGIIGRTMPDADGEVVWSRYPDADIKPAETMILQATVARKPGHRGERAISR
jgi:hypothetical protein